MTQPMPNESEAVDPPRCACARCGYLLQVPRDAGETDREGVCTECGLLFSWKRLLSGELFAPRWLVEHAPSLLRAVVSIPATILAAMIPWWLWRKLRMEHPIRPMRWILLLVGFAFAGFVLIRGTAVVRLGWAMQEAEATLWSASVGGATFVTGRIDIANGEMAKALARAFFSPSTPTTLTVDYVPLRALDSSGATVPLPPKATRPHTFPPLSGWIEEGFARAMSSSWIAGGAATVSVGAFVALPIARRRAKVRWRHIARAWVYLLVGSSIAAMTVGLVGIGAVPTLAVVAVALLVLWHAAVSMYLRMERPLAVALSVTLIGLLVALLAVTLHSLYVMTVCRDELLAPR